MFNKIWEVRLKSHHEATAPLRQLPKATGNLSSYLNGEKLTDKKKCIYIHVPYCSRICSFCNLRRFYGEPAEDYAELIVKQIHQYQRLPYIRDSQFDAVYFGGGTPSTLSAEQLARILGALRDSFILAETAEISLESSITDLCDEKLCVLKEGGLNRFSIGVQTFVDRGRELLNRRGSGRDVARRLGEIIDYGFRNTNIDLIYNYPGQSIEELESDLQQVQALDVAGLSYYSLILRDKSSLAQGLGTDNASYSKASLEREYDFWQRSYRHLRSAGFETLELTKLVRPGRDNYQYIRIRHDNGDTLPLGAGAGGRIDNLQLANPLSITDYREQVERPVESVYEGKVVDPAYNGIYRQIGQIQLGYLEFDAAVDVPFVKRNFDDFADFVSKHELGKLNNSRIVFNIDGIFWGNNLSKHYAQMMVKSALTVV